MDYNSKNSSIRSETFTDIPSQFPSFYLDKGELFVDFIKSYYEWADKLEKDYRDILNIRDIDTTYDQFLIYFKNKYMQDMPINSDVDTRFILKNIQDMYRRKGSEESIRLLFKLFFDEEIEIHYPSSNILKLSDSNYKSSKYIEMLPVKSFKNYSLRKFDRIEGDTSKAKAFIEEIIFRNFDGVYVPIVFLSNITGSFVRDDGIKVIGKRVGDDGTTNIVELYPGRIIRGSINSATVLREGRLPNNKIGDELYLYSDENGIQSKCIVTDVTTTATGIIDFEIKNSGYGYSSNTELNEISISNQVMLITSNTENSYDLNDIISCNTLATDTSTLISGEAKIVEYDSDQSILFIESDDANTSFNILPVNEKVIITNVTKGFDFEVSSISQFNDSASFDIDEITNTETVEIITDTIGDFINVQLNSSDYGMSGANNENLNTQIKDAFTPETFTIGEIDSITIKDSGADYQNDVRVSIVQPRIIQFDRKNVGIIFSDSNISFRVGERITQTIDIEDLTYTSNTVPYTVKADFLNKIGETYYFEMKSFHGFNESLSIDIRNNTYDILSIIEDSTSKSIGSNAVVSGEAQFEIGRVKEVSILDTGYRYRDGETVSLKNSSNNTVAFASILNRGQGFTEGKWTTTSSTLNNRSTVFRDNHYYQEYSYDISTIVNPNDYENLTKNLVQVAGTKQFNSPFINTENIVRPSIDVEMSVYTFEYPEFIDESNTSLLEIENANTIFISVVTELDDSTTDNVNQSIG